MPLSRTLHRIQTHSTRLLAAAVPTTLVLVIAASGTAAAQAGHGGYGGGMMGGTGGYGFFGAGMFLWPLLLLGLFGLVVWQLMDRGSGSSHSDRTGPNEDAALAELRRRYARGEIAEDEYQRRRELLRRDR